MQMKFTISTDREEQAYRLGYIKGWRAAQLSALVLHRLLENTDRVYQTMLDYSVRVLWRWVEAPPVIQEPPPEIEYSRREDGEDDT